MFDGGGLYLEVRPAGGKWWRFKYRFGGKEKLLALGTYPDVSLKQARDRRDTARKHLSEGANPSQARKAEEGRNSGACRTHARARCARLARAPRAGLD
jgi:hypothetical protein